MSSQRNLFAIRQLIPGLTTLDISGMIHPRGKRNLLDLGSVSDALKFISATQSLISLKKKNMGGSRPQALISARSARVGPAHKLFSILRHPQPPSKCKGYCRICQEKNFTYPQKRFIDIVL